MTEENLFKLLQFLTILTGHSISKSREMIASFVNASFGFLRTIGIALQEHATEKLCIAFTHARKYFSPLYIV